MNRLSFVVNKVIQETIIVFVNAIAFVESSLGLAQALRLKTPGHVSFAMTGSFANPGPYGGLIAILLAILGVYVWQNRNAHKWYDKGMIILSSISCVLCVIVLPATMSRASWLALGIASVFFGFKELNLLDLIRKHKVLATIASVLVIIVMTGIFFLKMDSAIGRFHIWHMELRAIAEKPWRGHGKGSVLGVYGNTQAEYFAEKERPEIITKVAGCPEYAFNEYLKIGIEFGIPAMMVVIMMLAILITVLLKISSPFAYGLIVLCVFAFFSYPLEAIHIRTDAERKWDEIRYLSGMELYDDAVEELAPLYEDLNRNFRYLYDYGYALHKCGRYEQSIKVLKEGAALSSDPMFYNIIGRNYESQGFFEEAEIAYLHSHYMVPSRIYPLYLLMNMKMKSGDNLSAIRIGEKISSMRVNEKVLNMSRLKTESLNRLDSLKVIVCAND